MDDFKCPGLTQNHEIINFVKPCHFQARTGSSMSVVTKYAQESVTLEKQTILQFSENVSG